MPEPCLRPLLTGLSVDRTAGVTTVRVGVHSADRVDCEPACEERRYTLTAGIDGEIPDAARLVHEDRTVATTEERVLQVDGGSG